MAKKNQNRYIIKEHNKKKELLWDDLNTLNKELKAMVKDTGEQIKALLKKYADVIDNDKSLSDQILGASKIISFVSDEIKKLERTHIDKETNEFYKGKVAEDTKELDLYITVLMGYENLITKVSNEMDNVLVTISGEVAEKAEQANKTTKQESEGVKNGE